MKTYQDFGIYDFSDYAEEITGDALFKINGGAEVENSIEAQANAQVGDTLVDSHGVEHTLTQGDITWAQGQVGAGGNSSNSGNTTSSSQGSPIGQTGEEEKEKKEETKNIHSEILNTEVPEEIKTNPQAYAYYMALQGKALAEGNSDKYKGYNVLGNGKISVKEVKGETVSGNSIVPVLQGSSEQFATIMESLVGSAYVWGGNSPEDGGMDCSGSVIYALNQMGNNIPDVTANTLYNEYTVPIQGPVQRGNSRFLLNDDGTSAYHIQTITSGEGARVNATGDNTNTITNPGSIDLLSGPLPQSGVIRTFVFSGDQ